MAEPVLLAIDLGTSACKVVLCHGDQVVAEASEAIATTHPGPGLAEQDPADWWAALRRLVARVMADRVPVVDAIGVTAQSDSLVAVGDDGEPVHPCILWLDGRGEPGLRRIREAIGDGPIHRATGLRPALSFTAPKVAWLREHEPGAWHRTRWILQPKDYLVYRLTGIAVTDPSSAARSMLLDRRTDTWWPDMMEAVGIEPHRLPDIRASGSAVGTLTMAAALGLGLEPGAVVAAGAADRAAEALASGVTGDEVMVSMGTATGILMSIERSEDVADPAILTPAHAVAGRSMALLSVAPSGAAVDWLMRLLAGGALDDVARARLLTEAEATAPGAGGVMFLPFLHGAKSVRWDQDARGVLAGLDLSADRGTLVRAAFEGIGFETSACIRRLAAARHGVGCLVLLGGGQRDTLAARLLVDITGSPALRLDELHGGAAGAMLLAGQAIGAWSDPASFARARRHGQLLQPDATRHALYAGIAPRYEHLCEAMGFPALEP